MPLWPSLLANHKSVEKRQDNTQAWLYVCVCGYMCNFNLDSGVCLSSVQAGLISQEPLGQLQGRSDAGESETLRWLTDVIYIYIYI